ncbi:MAG: hypothetical protein AABY06_02735 [Nanoarchaeota archaeon]
MKNKIQIFNSKDEAKGLEGTLIQGGIKIIDGNDPLEKLFYYFLGKFTPIQRLEYEAKTEAKKLNADYGIITDKYLTYVNSSAYVQTMNECDKLLTIKVNFYKQKLK